MKSITLGLALSLMGGVAVAQTPPPPTPPPLLKQPAAGPSTQQPMPSTSPAPQPSAQPGAPGQAATGAPNVAAQSGPPEGMVIETPNGLYLVRPGEAAPRRLDMGQSGTGQPGMADRSMGQNGPAAVTDGDEALADMGEDGMQPIHHPRRPMPPHPPEGKGARFRIRTPNLTLGVKCPDDEPIKACVDAVSQLLDKANQPH